MTICTKCKADLQNSEFKQNHRKKNGLSSWCKLCTNLQNSEREKTKAKTNRKPPQIYVDWGGTPCLLGIALGIAPKPHDVDKDHVVCGAGQGSGRKQRLSVWSRAGEM
jgi:hypothetical protein